jgi:hypothetical protein
MPTEENQFVRFVEDMMLKWEHMPEIRNRHVPDRHDAVIIAAPMASHELYQSVKEVYSKAGKPIFLTKGGMSEIKHEIEVKVFGNESTLKAMRRPLDLDDSIPITYRVWWVLGRFLQPGQEFKLRALNRFFDKFAVKGHEKAIANVWYRGRTDGCLEESGKGAAIFHGVPENAIEKLSQYNLYFEDEDMMRQSGVIVRPRTMPVTMHGDNIERLEKLFSENPQPMPAPTYLEPQPVQHARSSEESEAVMQLVLETMAQMQSEIKGLKDSIGAAVQLMIRSEMKGINTLIGEIQPQLADLNPEQLEQIKNMINIMKMAYGSRK